MSLLVEQMKTELWDQVYNIIYEENSSAYDKVEEILELCGSYCESASIKELEKICDKVNALGDTTWKMKH